MEKMCFEKVYCFDVDVCDGLLILTLLLFSCLPSTFISHLCVHFDMFVCLIYILMCSLALHHSIFGYIICLFMCMLIR